MAVVRVAVIGCALARTAMASSPPDELRVIVREIPACRVAYLEHVGPYWTVGETLRAVYDDASTDVRPRRFFARFASSPLASRSAALRAEVGYALAADSTAKPNTDADTDARSKADPDTDMPSFPRGFQLSERPAELAACVNFESGDAPRAQDFSRLRQWIARNGYRSVGPVTEVYTFPAGEEPTSPRIELQMTIRPANDPREASTPSSENAAIAKHETNPAGVTPTTSTSAQPTPSPVDAPNLHPLRERQPTTASIPLVVRTDPHEAPTIAQPDEAASTPVPSSVTDGSSEVESRDATPLQDARPGGATAEPPRVPAPPTPPECLTLTERVLADVAKLSPETQTWLGSALLRVDAIGRALRKASPTPGELARCSSAIAQSFQRSAPPPGTAALKTPGPTGAATARPEDQRAVLRDLDILMMGIASRRSETGHAEDELTVLFDRIRTIVDSELSGSESAGFAPR